MATCASRRGHDLTAQAATLQAGPTGGAADATLSLNAGNNLTLLAGQSVTDVKNHLEVSNGLDHLTSNASSSISTLNRTTLSAGANGQVNLQSGADMTLAAVQVNANALSISASGNLTLATQSTHTNISEQHSDSDVMFMDTSDTGKKDQSTQYNQFNVQQLNIQATGQINAQTSVRDSAAALAQQPGMEWIGQLTSDPTLAARVNWQQVQEAHDKWGLQLQRAVAHRRGYRDDHRYGNHRRGGDRDCCKCQCRDWRIGGIGCWPRPSHCGGGLPHASRHDDRRFRGGGSPGRRLDARGAGCCLVL